MPWKAVLPASELGEDEVLGVDVDGIDIAIYRTEGAYFATSNICTHAYARLCDGYLDGDVIECPLHQAEFDIKTGAVLGGPTQTPLPTYPTRIRNDWVEVELPDD
jgi:nitrite reductase/ring-hydroxylating ferredoxin subunit